MGSVNPSRRQFLRGRLKPADTAIRLPWIIDEETFIELCNQCGDCVDVCPENIIQIADGGYPAIRFNQGECTFCHACTDICSQSMFTDFQTLPPWKAELTINQDCLVEQNIYCQSCRDCCEQNVIQFSYVKGSSIPEPSVLNEHCNGCGACISICPVQATHLRIDYV